MESLGSLRTIVGIVQDILAVVDTASGNKSRCGKVADRVRYLRDLLLPLRQLDGAQEEWAITDAAMRSLMDRLKEALSRALREVRRCQGGGGILRSLVITGGRMADPLDEVEREIDRCVQDLNLAMCVRLESRLLQQDVAARTDNGGGKDEGNKGEVAAGGDPGDEKADRALLGSCAENAEKDEEGTTAAGDVTAIGVPVCTGRLEHDHEMAPPMSYGYCYCHGHCYCQWRFSHGHGTGDTWRYAAAPSNPDYCNTRYSPPPHLSMFSDDNPNACSII